MSFTTAVKAQIVKNHRQSESDTGSSEVQIALFSERIKYLTEHLKGHPRDFHTQHGLTKLVSKRRKLMRYLKGINVQRYQNIIKALDIRG